MYHIVHNQMTVSLLYHKNFLIKLVQFIGVDVANTNAMVTLINHTTLQLDNKLATSMIGYLVSPAAELRTEYNRHIDHSRVTGTF